jgi:cytochrome c553
MCRQALFAPLMAVLLAAAFLPAHANETAVAAGDAVKGQEIATTVCAACHGPDGNGISAQFPKLAGQHPEYLLRQMQHFKPVNGQSAQRIDPSMNGMIVPYDDAQMRDLAAYYATLKQSPDTAKNRDTILAGQKLYRAGDAAKGIAACAGCHGPTGKGMPVQYPRIAGQYAEYTEKQLKAFRDGGRANDPNRMMRTIALKMTDAEIKAVADYIAGLR